MPPQEHAITSQHKEDEQQPQSQDERNDNESPSVVTEELRRQVSEMQIEMQRQASRHEKEQLQWKEERQRMTALLRQQQTLDKSAVSPRADPQSSQPEQSLSLLIDKNEGTQTTSSGSPQATQMLSSPAKNDSSIYISSQPEITVSNLEATGKADRTIAIRFIKLSPLLPKENSAFNDIPISREDKLLKRITERRPFGKNGDRTDGNRKRRVTTTILSKSRVLKGASTTSDEIFSRFHDFEPFRDSKNQAEGVPEQIAENISCKDMDGFSQTLSSEGETGSIQDGCHLIVRQSRFKCLDWYEGLVELEKQKESQLSPSRGQAELIGRGADNYYSTYKSSPDSGCKVNVGNDAMEKPILPTNRRAEHAAVKSRIQNYKRCTIEEKQLQKLDYENAKEQKDVTMNGQANMQSFENVQRRAREFEKILNYLDAKAHFYHKGADRPIRTPTSRR